MTERRREKQREHNRKWRAKNPDYQKQWRKAHPEHMRRYAANAKTYRRKYSKAHPEYGWKNRMAHEITIRLDAAAYAWHRKRDRERRVALIERKIALGLLPPRKREYRPMLSRRIPDWCVKGQTLDVHSPWLVENLTPSQRGYARELAIERKASKTGGSK